MLYASQELRPEQERLSAQPPSATARIVHQHHRPGPEPERQQTRTRHQHVATYHRIPQQYAGKRIKRSKHMLKHQKQTGTGSKVNGFIISPGQ